MIDPSSKNPKISDPDYLRAERYWVPVVLTLLSVQPDEAIFEAMILSVQRVWNIKG